MEPLAKCLTAFELQDGFFLHSYRGMEKCESNINSVWEERVLGVMI